MTTQQVGKITGQFMFNFPEVAQCAMQDAKGTLNIRLFLGIEFRFLKENRHGIPGSIQVGYDGLGERHTAVRDRFANGDDVMIVEYLFV